LQKGARFSSTNFVESVTTQSRKGGIDLNHMPLGISSNPSGLRGDAAENRFKKALGGKRGQSGWL